MKALRFALMTVLFSCVFQSIEAMAGQVYGSSAIVKDVANNTVRAYSRTEVDYDTAEYYTPYVCGELYKNGVSQVRACQGGIITASRNTQFTGVSSTSSLTSDHYVDMQFYDEEYQSYEDYYGYSFLPGYSYPTDWLFYPAYEFAHHYPVSIHLGSTYVSCLCACTTPPTESQWSGLSSLFPNMVKCNVCRLGAATPTYNCLAWAIDDTAHWWWKEADTDKDTYVTVSEMNAFLTSKGKSNIAYYGFSTFNVQHVAKKSGGVGVDCQITSKLGPSILIAHDMTQMEDGSVYGHIVGGN